MAASTASPQNPAKVERRNSATTSNSRKPAQDQGSSASGGGWTTTGSGARSLELVSRESFQQRREGMSSSCVDCVAEQRRNSASSDQHHQYHQYHHSGVASTSAASVQQPRMQKTNRIKRNSPIVVCLKDSIRLAAAAAAASGGGGTKGARAKAPAAIRNISHNRTTSSSSSSSSSSQIADIRRRDKLSKEEQRKRQEEEGQKEEEDSKRQDDSLPAYISFSSSTAPPPPPTPCSSFPAGKGSKNFNAFLSAIEKVHTKDEKPPLSAQNLDHPSISSFSDARERATEPTREPQGPAAEVVVLNNAAVISPTEAALALDAVRTAFAERDNVEVICNDLHSSRTNPTMVEGSEDSDISSCHPSSSDSSSSDAEDQDRGVPEEEEEEEDEEEEEELSKEELDRLSEHANGFAMRRYELPPHECPECLAAYFAYTHYYAQGSKFFKIEVVDRDDDTVHWSPDSQPDSVFDYPLPTDPSHTPARGPRLGSASAATPGEATTRGSSRQQKVNHIGQPHCHLPLPPFHRHIDTVSLDLTGSDVTFTVEQHPVDSGATGGSQQPTGPGGTSTSQQHQPSASAANETAAGNPELYGHNFYCTMFGFVPCVPGYCFIPAFYFMFPMWTIPKIPVPMTTTTTQPPPRAKQPPPNDDYDAPFYAFRPGPGVVSPPRRPWISLNQPDVERPVAIYTVMCYNVLCDKYATRQLYGYCPSWALSWDFRKKNILEEIQQYSADIINLQEVETEQFYSFFLPELRAEGYEGIFSPKSRARTMTEADRKHVDGCAIFFKHSKFNLLKEHLVEFNKVAIETAEGSQDMLNRVMTKDNIGLAALLETKDSVWENGVPSDGAQLLLVATCHIHWDPECCDVKLIQTMMLMNKLKNIMEETQQQKQAALKHQGTNISSSSSASPAAAAASPHCNTIPLILCGDLNSLPDSGVVEYLSLGRISANHRDFKDIGYEDSLRKLSSSGAKDAYSHAFHLSQAYSSDVMPYTNYTCDFKGTIDYVFYSRDSIRPLGILGPLDQEWFRQNRVIGCPNPQVPSDHLPLLVEFEMHAAPSTTTVAGSTTYTTSTTCSASTTCSSTIPKEQDKGGGKKS